MPRHRDLGIGTTALMLAITVILVGACGNATSSDTSRATGGPEIIPALADSLQEAGTPIGDGFSVVAGSWLVGARFPFPRFPGDSRTGWDAVVVVDDAPLRALQGYQEQARAAGYTDFVAAISAPRGPCVSEADPPPGSDEGSTQVDLDRGPARADRFICALNARRAIPAGGFDRVSMDLHVGPPDDCERRCSDSYGSYLTIAVSYSDRYAESFSEYTATLDPFAVAPLPVPELRSPPEDLRLPQVAEPIGADQRFFDGLVVEPGSEVVAPGSALGVGGGTGSYDVILRITGNPESVVESYLDRLQHICCLESAGVHRGEVEHGEYLYGSAAESGGVSASVVTSAIADGTPTFARISLGND